MKTLKVLLYIILGLGSLWVVLGLFAKKDYHIERSIEIDAPKELVYEQAQYFKNFENWSPWAKLDPKMKTTITGNDGTIGATYSWSGNKKVGIGQQTITALSPNRIDTEVRFSKPFESTSPTYLTFAENGDKTQVTWAFDIHVAFPWNGLSMFTDMDAAVGKDYAQGLENLKTLCEAIAHKKYRGYEIEELELAETTYVGVRKTIPLAEIPAFYAAQLPRILDQLQKKQDSLAGLPVALFWSYDLELGTTDMAAAFPINSIQKFDTGFSLFTLGAAKALRLEYYGAYDKTAEAHFAMDDFMAEKKFRNIPPVIEEYVTDPGQEPDTTKWLTRIIYFVDTLPDSTLVQETLPAKKN